MKRIFRIVGFLIAVASCAFAQPSDSSSTLVLAPNASEASSENLWVDLGVETEIYDIIRRSETEPEK